MSHNRRKFLAAGLSAAAAVGNRAFAFGQTSPGRAALGIPGPYRGRVAAVHHPQSLVENRYQADPVRDLMHRGMKELTGAESWAEAWRVFFEPGDVVGIKLNPVGRPAVISDSLVFHQIIDGLNQAGVKNRDIVAFDRYKSEFLAAGFDKWLPKGVRWTFATDVFDPLQLDMDGYDRDVYMEMSLAHPRAAAKFGAQDPHIRRSYVAKFLTKEVNKVVNLCVMKHHQSAGVTLALKNLSHGLVNNVNRSHFTRTSNACGVFIPAVVDLPVIRQKNVLNILDGIKAAYHGGPGRKVANYMWAHQTMYFSTDPVAMDRIGLEEINRKRAALRLASIARLSPDPDSQWVNPQPEHIELAGALGLGEFHLKKIELKKFDLR